jgi:hypothetical protein
MAQHSVQIGIGIKFAGQNQDGFPGQNQVMTVHPKTLCFTLLDIKKK